MPQCQPFYSLTDVAHPANFPTSLLLRRLQCLKARNRLTAKASSSVPYGPSQSIDPNPAAVSGTQLCGFKLAVAHSHRATSSRSAFSFKGPCDRLGELDLAARSLRSDLLASAFQPNNMASKVWTMLGRHAPSAVTQHTSARRNSRSSALDAAL